MKLERTKNAGRNMVFGILLKLYQIILPFLMRTAMIYFMGVEYLGLNSLFVSVLQVLNLAELGVGSAMVYSMYEPVTNDDEEKICALLHLYKIYYRVIGLVIAAVGLVLIPFLPHLIKGKVPHGMNIYILYLINLLVTLLSYWMFAYKNSVLLAYQRVDVISKVTLFTNTVQYIVQFSVLCFLHNYYAYVSVMLLTQIMNNCIICLKVNKRYPNLKARGSLDKEERIKINKRIKDLFTSKLGYVIVNSVDTIVISAALGLKKLAIYQNYYFIITSLIGIITIVFKSCMAGIGNSIIMESKKKNYDDLKTFTFIISWIAGFCSIMLLCVYQPFMEIWVGKKLQLGFSAVICFVIYYYVYEINQLLNTYKDAAGIWHKDRFRPLITAGTNLILNLILVQFWDIYGVILSTVISMLLVGMPWLIYNLFTELFDYRDLYHYVRYVLYFCFVAVITGAVTYGICSCIRGNVYVQFIVSAVICLILPNIVFYLCNRRFKEYQLCLALVDKMTKGKIKLLNGYVKKLEK